VVATTHGIDEECRVLVLRLIGDWK